MTSMNCSPPRAIAPSSEARLPAAKARMRNNRMSNIGSGIFSSMKQKATSRTMPMASPPRTKGLVQPVGCPPYG